MSIILLKKPAIIQPQGFAEVNAASDLLGSRKNIILGSNAYADVGSNKPFTTVSADNVVGALGREFYGTPSQSVATPNVSDGTLPLTMAAIFNGYVSSNAGPVYYFGQRWSGGLTAIVDCWDSTIGNFRTFSTPVTDGVYNFLVVTIDESRLISFYVNGVLIGSVTAGNTQSDTFPESCIIFDTSTVYGRCPLLVKTNKAWTAEQVKRFVNNPWQVFSERKILAFGSASSGIITTTIVGRLGQSGLDVAAKISNYTASGKTGSAGQLVSNKLASATSAGRIGFKSIIVPIKIAPVTIVGRISQKCSDVASKIGSSSISAKPNQTGQNTALKIANSSIVSKPCSAGLTTVAKISSQTAAGKLSARTQITAGPYTIGTVTTTVAAKVGLSGSSAQTKIASQTITAKPGISGQVNQVKTSSQAISGRLSAKAQVNAGPVGVGTITTTVSAKAGTSASVVSGKLSQTGIFGTVSPKGQIVALKTRQTTVAGLLSLKGLLVSGEFSIDRNLPSGEYGMIDVTPNRSMSDMTPVYGLRKVA